VVASFAYLNLKKKFKEKLVNDLSKSGSWTKGEYGDLKHGKDGVLF